MARNRCNYAECTPCFKDWIKFVKTRQKQSARMDKTDPKSPRFRISEQESIRPETVPQGYILKISKRPACRDALAEQARIRTKCKPKRGQEALVDSLLWAADQELNRLKCTTASRIMKDTRKYLTCKR